MLQKVIFVFDLQYLSCLSSDFSKFEVQQKALESAFLAQYIERACLKKRMLKID